VKRRLVRAIVAVTALTILLLGIPLAIVARHWYEDRNTVDLQRRAAEAAVDVSIDPADGSLRMSEDDGSDSFGVYDASGALMAGEGPATADAAVAAALLGSPTFDHATETIVYAIPVTARGDAQIGAVVRVAEPDAEVDSAVHRAWLIMAAVAGAALLLAWLIARRLARRLAEPVQQLAIEAEQIGAGGVVLAHQPSGVPEFDVLGDTLATTSARVAEVLARERAFSADVSHQLRTPLTGLRLLLESEPSAVTPRALAEVDRLQETVEHLLALSRDRLTGEHTTDLAATVRSAGERWRPVVAAHHRALHVDTAAVGVTVRASGTATGQIIDVLVDNAVVHGAGTIELTYRRTPGGVAIDVSDAGQGVRIEHSEQIFRRRHGSGHGIGLSLARSLAEADGGRLLLTSHRPPRFTLILPTATATATVGESAPDGDSEAVDQPAMTTSSSRQRS
jgi:signal transduction histidine kinase